ncbi:glycosyltransferase family 2 protein [Desulfococcus sp.]|uniref:glycosyltransferase family 2 protein n=1 Tax=Desulfococcus sp. TaxID=2025834 RepID=UPI003592F014
MAPSISIVTPSYKQGIFIERTIESVLKQKIPGLEYIIVDGGSRDRTVDILKRYGDRVQWTSEPDRGQADAVNKGIRRSRGEIIGWLNSDDVYYDGALAAVLEYFEARPDVDILYGDAHHIDAEDRIIEPYYTEDWDYERLKEICFICQPSVFFRRSLAERVGLLDDRLQYCMDYEYWLRIGRTTPFARMNRFLAGSRMYDSNKTLGARVAVHREMNDMLKRTLGAVPVKWIYGYAHVKADQRGLDRAHPSQNLEFVVRLVGQAMYAFFHWKRKISPREFMTMAGWLLGSLKNVVRQFG